MSEFIAVNICCRKTTAQWALGDIYFLQKPRLLELCFKCAAFL